MKKIIRQTVVINAAPKQVYAALIDEKKHAKFSGAPATISRQVGGAFTCYGGYLTGINVELVPAKRIVQAWRSKSWPSGVYSIVSFAFSRKAGGKTKLALTHVGVPASDFKGVSKGWPMYYWKPIKAYLEK
jgi:activator of HSP90 ATPase